MKVLAIIPARLGSTRLPKKVLREIAGQPMLAHVYNAARSSTLVDDVLVATDSEEIMAVCRSHGWKARMTSAEHRSGTDRVREVVLALNSEFDVYINVQGDEPLARAEHIEALLKPMMRTTVWVSTVMTPCPQNDIANPNAVKVVTDMSGRALYFSRSTIPYDRDLSKTFGYMKHLGFYAYRKQALDSFCGMPESSLERSERLEQLRFLENGIDIYVAETAHDTIGVDTEEDLKRVEAILNKRESGG
jgi:3-deoxy-manno-octulosonate cytidylyltransferase (CMP-KDO synthetase)